MVVNLYIGVFAQSHRVLLVAMHVGLASHMVP